jgi:hypothetical protein
VAAAFALTGNTHATPTHAVCTQVTDIPAISDHTEKVLKEADGKQGVIQEMLDLPRTVMRGARVLPTEMLQLPQTVMRGAMRGARLVPEIIHNRLARLRAHHSSAARASAAAAAAAAVAHDVSRSRGSWLRLAALLCCSAPSFSRSACQMDYVLQ